MANRYHIPVVITTDNDVSREEASDAIEQMVKDLEETDFVYRTYVEQMKIDQGDSERLLEMLFTARNQNIGLTEETISYISNE